MFESITETCGRANGNSLMSAALTVLESFKAYKALNPNRVLPAGLSTPQIVAEVAARGLWACPRGGKTPSATLYAAFLRECNIRRDDRRIVKVGPGRWAFAGDPSAAVVASVRAAMADDAAAPDAAADDAAAPDAAADDAAAPDAAAPAAGRSQRR